MSDPSWGFIYNSVPFGMNFRQTLGFLYDAKLDEAGRNGIALAQADARQPRRHADRVPGRRQHHAGLRLLPAADRQGRNATRAMPNASSRATASAWPASARRVGAFAISSPPEDIVSRACDLLVQRGIITAKTLQFYPAVGGQSVLLPMQTRTIQGFEFITPIDDLVDFFPVKDATSDRPLGDPDAGHLDCSPAVPFPIPAGTKSKLHAEHRPARRALRASSGLASAVPAVVDACRQGRLERPERRPAGGHPEGGEGIRNRELQRNGIDRVPRSSRTCSTSTTASISEIWTARRAWWTASL